MKDIVLFFNGDRGVKVLEEYLKSEHSICALVTPLKINEKILLHIENSKENHLISNNVNDEDFIFQLKKLRPQIFVVAGFPQIFKKCILEIPKRGILNLHAGKLPEYRGGSPLNWQMINGESEAWISIIQMDEGIDTGIVLGEVSFSINGSDNIVDLHNKANKLFPQLLFGILDKLDDGSIDTKIQDEKKAQYWHQRNDHDGKLEFDDMTSTEVDRMIRALTKPYPGSWGFYQGRIVRLFSSKIPSISIKGNPGRILYLQGKGPYIICKDKAILITHYEIDGSINEQLKNGERLK